MSQLPAVTGDNETAEQQKAREGDAYWKLLAQQKNAVTQVLPKHLTPERLIRIAYAAAIKTPKLRECTPGSIVAAVITCSQLGLEPNTPLGLAYLIPRWSGKAQSQECTILLGYKGLLDLMRRSGEIRDASASVIYADELDKGLFTASIEPPDVQHKWSTEAVNRSADAIVGAYCVVRTKDGGRYQVILTRDQIEARRVRGASGQDKSTPWDTDYEAMARKSAIRALLTGGMVPLSVELATALDEDADKPEVIDTTATPSRRATGDDALGLKAGEPRALPDHGEQPDLTPKSERVKAEVIENTKAVDAPVTGKGGAGNPAAKSTKSKTSGPPEPQPIDEDQTP